MSQGATGRSVVRPPGHPGITLLLVTKLLDAGTTGVGLLVVPRAVETNPFAAALFARFGVVPGLTLASVVIVAVVVAVTELGVWWLGRSPETPAWAPGVTRAVGYVPPSLLFGLAALSNASLLWGHL